MQNFKIERSAGPAYAQVRDNLIERIREGAFTPGAPLPGRQALSVEYGLAYGTVGRALQELSRMGVVTTHNGVGSFVNPDFDFSNSTEGIFGVAANFANSARGARIGIITNNDPGLTKNWYRILCRNLEVGICDHGASTYGIDRFEYGLKEPESMARCFCAAREKKLDALVVIGILYPTEHLLDIIEAENGDSELPVVCISWEPMPVPVRHVYYSNMELGYTAGKHLFDSGYRDIVFLSTYGMVEWEEQRLAGIRRAFDRRADDECAISVVSTDGEKSSDHEKRSPADMLARQRVNGYNGMNKALDSFADSGEPVRRACIVSSDPAAFGALDCLEERGTQPGADIGIIGFDDDPEAGLRGMSSVRPPLEKMAEAAVRMLFHESGNSHFQLCCSGQLMARESSHCGAHAGQFSPWRQLAGFSSG